MKGRIQSIDALRGLTITGMVLCASYAASSGLPAWMFHCQVPPPDCIFRPEVRGITWVDLVFPFFLFSMGAAFPFSLGSKVEKGKSRGSIIIGLLKRWAILSFYSLAIGNAYNIYGSGSSELLKGLFMVGVWAGFFLAFVRTKRKWVNPAGWLLLAVMFLLEQFCYKVPLNLHSTDIIIMIMACVSISGGLIWLFTQNRHALRSLVFAAVFAVKAVTYYGDALDFLAMPHCISWLVDWGFFQYLLIVIPASIVGDWLRRYSGETHDSKENHTENRTVKIGAAVLPPLAAALQLWGLYTRNVFADFAITAVLALTYTLLTHKKVSIDRIIAYAGFSLLVAGIAFDPLDGGIAKDWCNISYLLATGGMAALIVSFFLRLENSGRKLTVLSLCGQNPMLAYTVSGFLTSPVLYACGLLGLLDTLSVGSIVWGLARAFLVTGLMCAVTCMFSKSKIYWRS